MGTRLYFECAVACDRGQLLQPRTAQRPGLFFEINEFNQMFRVSLIGGQLVMSSIAGRISQQSRD